MQSGPSHSIGKSSAGQRTSSTSEPAPNQNTRHQPRRVSESRCLQRPEQLAYLRIMRNSFVFIGLTAALLAGCGTGSPETPPDATPPDAGPPTNEERLAESLSAWMELKAADDGTYQYSRSNSSFSGYRNRTTFLVENDVVVRRSFEETDPDGAVSDSFVEEGAEVGSNEGTGADPALTIEELYEICRDEVLTQDPERNIIELRLRDDGILEYCFYVPRDCADDCAEGVEIENLDMNL